VGVVGAGAAFAVLCARVARGVQGAGELALVGLALLVGWVLADLVSGVVHWWADRIASEDTPIFGPAFVRPFREHHEDPLGICRNDWVETNGNTCIAMLPFLLAACLWPPPQPLGGGLLFSSSAFVALALWSGLTNQIHCWAHQPRPPRVVRALQRAGLLLSSGHHARHHTPPFARHYCITTGWLNPLLDSLGVFPALEDLRARTLRSAAPRPARRAAP
jgi:ubiquitin-conjugating enzyme E2 variant